MPDVYDGIIDIYHGDNLKLRDAQRAGITAVIHKASEGATVPDPMYAQRRHEALGLGLLWGAYHFSSGMPPETQAKNFLNVIQWGADKAVDAVTLLCLDFEDSQRGPDMSVGDACTFVSIIKQKTGRWPLVYGSNLIQKANNEGSPTCALANCPLWYASYNTKPLNVPNKLWKKLTLWQFTDGGSGPQPHTIGNAHVDRNRFMGTQDELKVAWPSLS